MSDRPSFGWLPSRRAMAFAAAVGLSLLVGAPSPTDAALTDSPVAWTVFTNIRPILSGGAPVRDPEGGKNSDASNGGASFSAESDIASGYTGTSYTCNPVGAGTTCGQANSMFWDYYDGGTTWDGIVGSDTMRDDFMFLRMRVDGDPSEPPNPNRFNNSHWNYLHDIDSDGYKEFWFDVFGNNDIVRILYQDNPSQGVTSDADCSAGGTVVEYFVSCINTTGTNFGGQPCTNSFTRAYPIGDGTGEWYVDIQVPLYATRDCSGNYIVTPDAPRKFLFSTSDSSTDPIQKDFTPGCNSGTLPTVTCNFSDATPVTVSWFQAVSEQGRLRLEWATTTELGNAGFNVWARTGDGWVRLNQHLVATQAIDSLQPIEYSLTVDAVDALEFAIEDVDVRGHTRWHGGLMPDGENGRLRPTLAIDWQAIRAEHAAKDTVRRRAARVPARGASRELAGASAAAASASWPVYELHLSEDGLYRVTYEQLAAAGLDLAGVAAAQIALTNRGEPVPIRVEGSSAQASTFGPGGLVEFYGRKLESLYTETNVYRVVVDAAMALRVAEDRSVPPRRLVRAGGPGGSAGSSGASVTTSYVATSKVEHDLKWSFAAPNGDPWYERQVLATTTPVSVDLTVAVDGLEPGPTSLDLGLWGVTDWPDAAQDHHVAVAVNGVAAGDVWFDGLTNAPLHFSLPDGVVHEGANTVTLTLPGDTGYDYDIVAVDRYAITYPRELQARDGALQFLAAGGWLRVTGLSDSDVVAYRFEADGTPVRLLRTVAFQEGNSFTANVPGSAAAKEFVVASVDALATPTIVAPPAAGDLVNGSADYLIVTHPDFADGLGDLVAARQAQGLTVKVARTDWIYSAFGDGILGPEAIRAYVRWAAANLGTRFVLLVGAESYDPMDHLGVGSMSFVPAFYVPTEALMRFTPVDGPFGDLDGDMIPELAVGRFPVRTSAELAAMIAKTLTYPGNSSASAVFAADKSELFGKFAEISDTVIGELPEGWSTQRAYLDDLSASAARDVVVGAINSGTSLTHFIGHSDLEIWTFDGLFGRDDALALTNVGSPTVVVQWGCWNSFFALPTGMSLAERLLVSGEMGAAAVIGPSGRTSVDGDREMSLRLTPALLEPGTPIGEALSLVKQEIATLNPVLADVYLGVNLLGDPALELVP